MKRTWSSGSRKLAVLLLAVAVPPAATLVWLGLQLLHQDRLLLVQRDLERRQAAMQAAVHSLQLSLTDAEGRLVDGPVPEGMARFVLTTNGVRAEPADRVLWVPVSTAMPAIDDERFAEAERLEYRGNAERAAIVYQEAARSGVLAVRAAGLVRLARVRRSQRRWEEALAAYRDLARHDDVVIAGAPADLQARRAACDILETLGRTAELTREADALEADLLAGRWTLDRPAWELTVREVEAWTGRMLKISAERRMFSLVAEALWNDRQGQAESRRVVEVDGTLVTVLWRSQDARTTAVAVAPSVLSQWLAQTRTAASNTAVEVSVLAVSGDLVAGPVAPANAVTLKATAADTGLPWTIALIRSNDASMGEQELASRRRLMSAALATILLMLGSGSYFLWRVMRRELAVAKLQTDFVSAVSHEFRTPLTSLRHVTELLDENDALPSQRRKSLYEALGRNTERLQRLVESLLDFARMESGRRPYSFQPLDAAELVRQVVNDFQKEVSARGFTIALDVDMPDAPSVRADGPSLTNALWNLLDNAVKYSPDTNLVRVSVRRHAGGIAISVHDKGLGIPGREQKDIFHRFVRGETAIRLGIKGTGLGLAMVSHIVHAHAGTIEVESKEGGGSTFTIVLPAYRLAAAGPVGRTA